MKQNYLKKITKFGIVTIITALMLAGCGKNEEITTEDGETVSLSTLQQQVEILTAQVNSMQETIDRYYAGSVEGEQTPTYAIEDITYETLEFADRILVVATNNGTEPVMGLKVLATFYDSQNNMLATKENYLEIAVPGATGVAEFDFVDSDFTVADTYDHVEIALTKEPYSFTRKFLDAANFTVTANKTDSNDLVVKVENNGTEAADMIQITALFYQNGEIVGYNTNSMINLQAGAYDTKNLYGAYTYETDGTTVNTEYDDYKVMISSVYNY